MQNRKLNELAEALAAQASTADSDLAGDADEGVFEGLRSRVLGVRFLWSGRRISGPGSTQSPSLPGRTIGC